MGTHSDGELGIRRNCVKSNCMELKRKYNNTHMSHICTYMYLQLYTYLIYINTYNLDIHIQGIVERKASLRNIIVHNCADIVHCKCDVNDVNAILIIIYIFMIIYMYVKLYGTQNIACFIQFHVPPSCSCITSCRNLYYQRRINPPPVCSITREYPPKVINCS